MPLPLPCDIRSKIPTHPSYLQCCFKALQLRQTLPNLPVGHSRANDIIHTLQEAQLLPVLFQSLLEAACPGQSREPSDLGQTNTSSPTRFQADPPAPEGGTHFGCHFQ